MDPTATLKIIFETARFIQQTAKDVKANQKQCQRLGERIDAINSAMKSWNGLELQRRELQKALDNFRNCVEQCLKFVTKFKDKTSWFIKIFNKQNYKEQFEKLNLRLTQCATDLHLGINLKQIFDHKLDEKDQTMDLNDIKSKIDEIAYMMEQNQGEQLRRYQSIEQNIKDRLNSFKHHLEQRIVKVSDPVKAQEIVEEEHAFLHIPYYDLIQEKRIGQGGFADVYRGRWLSRDDEVAIKVIRIQYLDERVKGDFTREISMMHKIRYNHILNIFGACIEPGKYALVVEYMSLGSLFDVLKDKKLQLAWPNRCSVAIQMTRGINYLHQLANPIIHRDIKSLNILMTKWDKSFLVKVADFGLAKIRRETSRQSSHNSSVGTLPWKAPELLDMGRHTEASDVYALGVVLWELATECEPYEEADDATISAFVLRGARLPIPENIPNSFTNLISRAWMHEPEKRPTCRQLLSLMNEVLAELDAPESSQVRNCFLTVLHFFLRTTDEITLSSRFFKIISKLV